MTREEILKLTQEYHQKTNDNVIGVGYGFKMVNGMVTNEKSIVFTVKEKKPIESLSPDELLPSNIDLSIGKVSTDVIQGNIRRLECQNNIEETSNRVSFRPLLGGISCSAMPAMSASTGTLGFFAIDNDTNTLVGVSNNHVLIKDAFISSEQDINGELSSFINNHITQPHEYLNDDYPIGLVKRYHPLRSPIFYNTVDVALTTVISGTTYIDSGISYKQANLSDTITGLGLDFATTEELDNLLTTDPLLYSAGRTTGAKGEGSIKLRVDSIADSITVEYNKQGVETIVYFTDLIHFVATTGSTYPYSKCKYPIYSGDSGSALIADINGTKKIIGLCFAGGDYDGFACRIDNVASLMNISAWKGENVGYSTGIVNEYIVNGLSNDEYVDYNGHRYYQAGLRQI